MKDLETVKEGTKEGHSHGGKKEKKEKKKRHKRDKHRGEEGSKHKRQKESEEMMKHFGYSPIREANYPSTAYIDHNPTQAINSYIADGPSTEHCQRQEHRDFAPLKRDNYVENRRYDQPLQGRH